MNQKELWKNKWNNKTFNLPPNNFAVRSCKIIKKDKQVSLLDIGCGNGRDAIYFAKKGISVTAVDWSESGLDQLKNIISKEKINNIVIIEKDVCNLDLDNNSYDIIYAHLSLHYFSDIKTRKIFDNLYNILKKGGLLFIKCKSKDDALYAKGDKIEANMFSFQNHIRHFFDKEYMASLLNKFQVIKIRKTSSVYHSYKSSFIEAIAKK